MSSVSTITGSAMLTVAKANTLTQLYAVPGSRTAYFLHPTLLQVYVALTNGAPGTPSGIVTLFDGSTQVATAMLDNTGNATFNTTNLSFGVHALSVTYAGDSNFKASASGQLVLRRTPAPRPVP